MPKAVKAAKRKAKSPNNRWLKLLLIPYTALYVWLMGLFDLHSLDFLKRFMDFWGRDAYTLNFVCAFVCLAGLLLLIFGPTRYRPVVAIGLLMFLMPVWFQSSLTPAKNSIRDPYVLKIEWNTLIFLYEILTALWATMLVRGDVKTEWVKLIMALVLVLGSVFPYLHGADEHDVMTLYMKILPLSLLTGFVLDFCMNGFSLQSLLPALISVAVSFVMAVDLSASAILWGFAASCLIAIVFLLIKKREAGSIGGVAALVCMLINAAVFMLSYLWKIDIPKVF